MKIKTQSTAAERLQALKDNRDEIIMSIEMMRLPLKCTMDTIFQVVTTNLFYEFCNEECLDLEMVIERISEDSDLSLIHI